MKRIIVITGVLLTAVALLACSGTTNTNTNTSGLPGTEVQVEGGSYWLITPVQLHSMLGNKDFFMVNTDVSYMGEIPGTDLFITYDQIEQNLDKFPADKASKIVVYCSFGNTSALAAAILVKAGYTSVMDLQGGMQAWQNQGYTITQRP